MASAITEVITAAAAVGPFAVNWIKDYFSRFPVVAKYTYKLGKNVALPFAYIYYHMQTYEGFDKEEFAKIFRSNPANADASDEEVQNVMDKIKFVSDQLNKAFLKRKEQGELTDEDKKYYYLIPRNEEQNVDMDKLLNYMKKTSANAIRLNIPILQLMFIPGSKQLGEKLNMTDDELKMNAKLTQLFEGVLEATSESELTSEQRQQVEQLKRLNKSVQEGDVSSVKAISAASLQQYIATSLAKGDKEGAELGVNVLKNMQMEYVSPSDVTGRISVAEDNIPDPQQYKKVLYEDISDEKVRQWIVNISDKDIYSNSIIELPNFMAPDSPVAPDDASVDVYVQNFGKKMPEKLNTPEPVQGSQEPTSISETKSLSRENTDNMSCSCMKPRLVAVVIILIVVLVVISSLPRYLTMLVLFILAAWLVWDNRAYIERKYKEIS